MKLNRFHTEINIKPLFVLSNYWAMKTLPKTNGFWKSYKLIFTESCQFWVQSSSLEVLKIFEFSRCCIQCMLFIQSYSERPKAFALLFGRRVPPLAPHLYLKKGLKEIKVVSQHCALTWGSLLLPLDGIPVFSTWHWILRWQALGKHCGKKRMTVFTAKGENRVFKQKFAFWRTWAYQLPVLAFLMRFAVIANVII